MQLLLPIYPKEAWLISDLLGVYEHDGIVQYLVSGMPVYCHPKEDEKAFRFITSNFIHQGLCRNVDVERGFNVSESSVQRNYKIFLEKGEAGFFGEDARHGHSHKIVGERRIRMQEKLDRGQSVNSIAKEEGVREGAIRYAIKQGYLRKKVDTQTTQACGSNLNERNEADQSAPLGIATTRFEDRVFSSLGEGGHAEIKFEESRGLCGAGIMFLVPALISQGLLKTKEVYQLPPKHYYGLESVVLTLAFMFLSRVKNPEQLKQCKPGEIGRSLGLDRIPEVKCIRKKIHFLTQQNKAIQLNNLLIKEWYNPDENKAEFILIDNHNCKYYGEEANLTKKYIAGRKLCLSATTECWVNDETGMPIMAVIGELSENLQTFILEKIIPQMQQAGLITPVANDEDKPQCTYIFDREAYQPTFFQQLWQDYKIAIITYRKNVKDNWDEKCFKSTVVTVLGKSVTMQIYERETVLGGVTFREIRKLCESGHQTAIITTHPTLDTVVVAGKIFGRWIQENFFKYMIANYFFDKFLTYGIEAIDPNKIVNNPEYKQVNKDLKSIRTKIQRLEAKFYSLIDQIFDESLDAIPALTNKQIEYQTVLDKLLQKEQELLAKRAQLKPKIPLGEMPEQLRYNKLKTEHKMLINILKMICYRAEAAVASLLATYLNRANDEKFMLVKQIISANADIIPDYKENTLTIILHSLSANRFNEAANKLAELLNDIETIFPGTNLRMIFKTSSLSNCER